MIDDQKIFFNTEMGLPIQIPYKIISMHEKKPHKFPTKIG